MEADSFISCGLLVSNSVTYLGSELPLRGLFLLQARQVTRLVGSFGGPIIREGTRYENVEIESPRVTAIPNGSIKISSTVSPNISSSIYTGTSRNTNTFHRFRPVLMHPFLSLIILSLLVSISSCFNDDDYHHNYKIDNNIVDFEPKKPT